MSSSWAVVATASSNSNMPSSNGLQGGGGSGSASGSTTSNFDPVTNLLNQQLAIALSTMGDAQYWEESISPNQIKIDLEKVSDPVNTSYHHIQQQIRCMKWLLANISKGRDVSDFYPNVIKLVGTYSLEVRKMVYMFTVQYANHNDMTRELSLLSINAFQRGLNDSEPLIRGLALRVLTNVDLNDIIQIQILAVQTCVADMSPYVRKCAANAIAKLVPRIMTQNYEYHDCFHQNQQNQQENQKYTTTNTTDQYDHDTMISNNETRTLLMDLLQNLLEHDLSTMVLTSAITSFAELVIANQPLAVASLHQQKRNNKNKKKKKKNGDDDDDNSISSSDSDSTSSSSSSRNENENDEMNEDTLELYRLHKCYRTVCHLLTDMDEWGQVIVLDILMYYCRIYFCEPIHLLHGTAERIDRDRRVRRPNIQIINAATTSNTIEPLNQYQQQQTSKNGPQLITNIHIYSSSTHKSSHPKKDGETSSLLPSRSQKPLLPPHPNHGNNARRIKRRVVKKGFYSDEEDESTEEEVYVTNAATNQSSSMSRSLLQPPVTGMNHQQQNDNMNGGTGTTPLMTTLQEDDNEDSELAPDHRLLLQSSLPLLKSRNAGVVVAVCSLHYYCGVASVAVRSAIGKALVRVIQTARQDNKCELQTVVLNIITQLVSICPSAFAPYMHDFCINIHQDTIYTQKMKLHILVQLALEPSAIRTVLDELRTYLQVILIRNDDDDNNDSHPKHGTGYGNGTSTTTTTNQNHGGTIPSNQYSSGSIGGGGGSSTLDITDPCMYEEINYVDDTFHDVSDRIQFACLVVRAVGQVAEMTHIVYERHAAITNENQHQQQHDDDEDNNKNRSVIEADRKEANEIILNCLHGLVTLTETVVTSTIVPPIVIGETIIVMQQILRLILSTSPIVITTTSTTPNSTTVNEQQDGESPQELKDHIPMVVNDPYHVQERAVQRIILFLLYTLNAVYIRSNHHEALCSFDNDDDNEDDNNNNNNRNDPYSSDITDDEILLSQLEYLCGSVVLPSQATVAAISIVSDVLAPYSVHDPTYQNAFGSGSGTLFHNIHSTTTTNSNNTTTSALNPRAQYRLEIARLLARTYLELTMREKLQAIHYASKILISHYDSKIATNTNTTNSTTSNMYLSPQEIPVCEHILALGRVDVNTDVRDRARFESNLLYMSVGFQYDTDALEDPKQWNQPTSSPMDATSTSSSTITHDLVPLLNSSTTTTTDEEPEIALLVSPKVITSNKLLSLGDVKNILLRPKPPASSLPPLPHNHHCDERKDESTTTGHNNRNFLETDGGWYRFGTLSSLVGHRARNAYLPLPHWAKENSPESLREPPTKTTTTTTTTASSAVRNTIMDRVPASSVTSSRKKNPITKDGTNNFYKSSSDEEDDNSNDDSSESSSSSDESDNDDDDNSSTSDNNNILLPGVMNGTSGPASHTITTATATNFPTRPQEMNRRSSSSSSSSSDSDDTSSDDDDEKNNNNTPSLLPDISYPSNTMTGSTTSAVSYTSSFMPTTQKAQQPPSTTYAAGLNDMAGLDWSAVSLSKNSTSATSTTLYEDYGIWKTLIKSEHSGGLEIQCRYIRGTTKQQMIQSGVQTKKISMDQPTVICVQLSFTNTKTDLPIRHIRLMQRSSSSSSTTTTAGSSNKMGPRKVMIPSEIVLLQPGQKMEQTMLIDFYQLSDREGAIVAKFDCKFGTSSSSTSGGGSGSIPLEIKPTLCDLLLPPSPPSPTSKLLTPSSSPSSSFTVPEFDQLIGKMHGFQRLESTFTISQTGRNKLPSYLLTMVAFKAIIDPKDNNKDRRGAAVESTEQQPLLLHWDLKNKIRFVGILPVSLDPIHVLITCPQPTAGTGSSGDGSSTDLHSNGTILICCDQALALNTIMNVLKRAIADCQ